MSLAHLREMAFGLWHSKSSIRPSHTYRPVHTPYTTTHPHLLFVTLHSNHGFNILPRLGTHGKIVSMCDTYSCVHIFMATRFAVRETYLFRLYVEVVPDGSFVAFCSQKSNCWGPTMLSAVCTTCSNDNHDISNSHHSFVCHDVTTSTTLF